MNGQKNVMLETCRDLTVIFFLMYVCFFSQQKEYMGSVNIDLRSAESIKESWYEIVMDKAHSRSTETVSGRLLLHHEIQGGGIVPFLTLLLTYCVRMVVPCLVRAISSNEGIVPVCSFYLVRVLHHPGFKRGRAF